MNTGGRYSLDLLPFIFSGLGTLQFVICPKQSCRAHLFSIVPPRFPCIVTSSVCWFQSLHDSPNTGQGTRLFKTPFLDLLCALCGKFLPCVAFPCRPLLPCALRVSVVARWSPVVFHGDLRLSRFISYRCSPLSHTTRGGTPLPKPADCGGFLPSRVEGPSRARNFFRSGTSNGNQSRV